MKPALQKFKEFLEENEEYMQENPNEAFRVIMDALSNMAVADMKACNEKEQLIQTKNKWMAVINAFGEEIFK